MAAEGFQPLEGVLPAVYARLLPALAASNAPIEAEATCSHCAMCAPADSTARGRKYFSPNSKCCTYHPTLPNYLVGALLADQQAEFEEGRRRIRAVIQHRAGVTPHGILPPKATSAVYDAVTPGLFGRAESLLCPYFDRGNGSCSIWQFREAVCSTFFCKFVHGGDGAEYWHGLKQVLIQAQTCLVQHALHQLGFAAHVILAGAEHDPTAEELDGMPTPDAVHRERFGAWYGQEEAFYVACFRAVEALDPRQVEALGGIRASLQMANLAGRRGCLESPELPDPLQRNPRLEQRREPDGAMTLVSFSALQPTRLRAEVLELLNHFDGLRPTAEVLATIESAHGYRLSPNLLVRLHHFRILVSADSD